MTEREIFLAVLDLPNLAAQAAYLDQACGKDSVLREKVEGLLRSHDAAGSFLGAPAVERPDPDHAGTMSFDASGSSGGSPRQHHDHDTDDLHFLTPSARPDSLGRIGHYEVLQVLGKGGFGIVFRAFDDVLQRVVAIKVMAPQLAATSPARKRFLREARTSAQVRHENVVQVYEVAEHPLPYLAMEFIPGETLQQMLDRNGPLDVTEVLRIGRQVAEGLAAAHATDLIHRDIKPSNVMIEGGPRQQVKITDFGLARAADDASISQSGIIAGTPMYMAPEQALGHKLDQRADLFSLGSVFYQMAAGRAPFRANSTVAVLKRVADDTPRDIREIIPETPQWLCDIISKLHAKNPDERYQSARDVADVLADCEAQLKANAKLKDFSRIPRNTTTARRGGQRNWVVVAAVVLLSVVALPAAVFTGVTLLSRGEQPTPGPTLASKYSTPGPAAKPEPLSPTFKNNIGMEFVIVPKGKSWLGGGKDKPGDQEVELPADFYLGKYEVTQEEWDKVMGENPSHFSRTGDGTDAVKDVSDADLKRFPVESVTWERCQFFVAKLNEREKETGWIYRLPKEKEWEYACRGGAMVDKLDSAFDFYFAKPTNTLLPEQANFNTGTFENPMGLKRTCKVGTYEPNRLGLFDMHGNVFEWCDDNWKVPEGTAPQLFRGGSWFAGDSGQNCQATFRYPERTSTKINTLGLRLARVPSGAPSPEAKTPPLAVAPFTDADVKRIAALPAAEQVEEVRKELMRRNPGFDGKVEHKVDAGVVTELRIVTDQVTDIAPIRVFNALRMLDCSGTYSSKSNGLLADLTPLKEMNLAGLTHIDLNHTMVGDAGLACFKDCKNLQELHLWSTKSSDAGLANFKDCKKLAFLDLGSTWVTDAGLANFKDCKGLTTLSLHWTKVSDAGLVHFQECKDLRHLSLAGTKVSDTGLAHFKNCKNLTSLHFDHMLIGDAGLAHFKGMPLMSVWFNDTGITDLTPLQGMPLEDIHLTPKNIIKGLDILRDMKSLKTIGIEWNQAWPAAEFWERYDKGEIGLAPFTDADVKRIAALPASQQIEEVRKELKKRNPDFNGILEHQIEGAVVTELKIKTDKVTDISPIRVFNYLRVLDLSGSEGGGQVNGQLADLSPLKGMNMSRLTRLLLGNTKIDDTGLVHFKDCKNLTHLWLSHTQVGNAGMACFKDCKNLTHLGLKYTRVDDAGLVHFKDCKTLIDLDLGALPVTDQGLAHFKECKDLTGLWLNSTQVTDAGLAHFQDCKNLASLHVSSTGVSDDGLAHLKGCKKLITVMLDGTRVTDAGLVHLVGRDEMTSLFLLKTKVTEKAVADLAKALPKCKITWDGGVIEPK